MRKQWTALGVFLLGVALATGVWAQPSQYLQLVEINVKAGSEAQFEAYVKKINEAADKTGAPQGWGFGQPVVGASGPTYYVFLQYDKWAERDTWTQIPQMLTKAFGEAEAQKLMKSGGDSMWGSQSTVYTLDKERSWNLGGMNAQPAPYYMILRGTVKPDMVDEYQRVIARLKEAQEKASTKEPGIRRVSSYGPSWEFYLAVPLQKLGDLDEGSGPWQNAAKAFGEAEARGLQETLRNCYEKRTMVLVAIREDLTRTPPSATSDN